MLTVRHGLKALFLLVLGVAVFLAVARTAGFFVTAGVAFALALIGGSVAWKARGVLVPIKFAVVSFALTTVWFLAVDWSWFVEYCPDCGGGNDIDQYRILGVPIYSRVEECPTIVQRALADLGVPCGHAKLEHWQKHRWWGLSVCAGPCWNGTSALSAPDDRYTENLAARLRQRGRKDPAFAADLHRRVVEGQEHYYFWDAFMIDELAIEWLRQANTYEALNWLRGTSHNDRSLYFSMTTDESIEVVQQAYNAGAIEVFAVSVSQYGADSNHEPNGLLLRLPRDLPTREQLLIWIDQTTQDREEPREDFGQRYVYFFP